MQKSAIFPLRRTAALSGLGLVYLVSASCWINQPALPCPEYWIQKGETCTLDPPGQTYYYANQCGEGSGWTGSTIRPFCTYQCSTGVKPRYQLTVVDGGVRCEPPPCNPPTQ